jgi:putative ABC transport system permease protein
MARQYWPNSDQLKDRILIGVGAAPAFAEGPRQVIGIVGDTHDGGPDTDPAPMMYIPLSQVPDLETALNSKVAPLYWFVRSQVDPRTLTTPISTALREASGGLPVAHIRTMEEIEAANIARQRLNMLLLTVFRVCRPAHGGDRRIWLDVLLRATAHTGTWRPHGARRTGLESS